MAYKFQKGAAHLDGLISGSSTAVFESSLSSSADIAVTGAVHAAQFYGGGAGITGISSDAVDVSASVGGSRVYGIVGTQGAQTNGSLGLITTVSGASFNPLDAAWGSKLLLSGNVAGLQASEVCFGEKAGIGMIDDDGLLLSISSSFAAIDISASHDGGIVLACGDGAEAGVGIWGDNGLIMYNSAEAVKGTWSGAGAISGAAGAQFVGAAILGNKLNVSGATTLAGKLSSSAAMEIVGQVDIVGTLNVTGSSVLNGGIDVNGSNFTVSTAGAVVAKSTVSASSTLQVVGTVNSIGAMASSGSITAGSSFIIGSADLNEVDMEKLDGITNGAGAANKALVLDASADVASGLRSVTASADLKAANVHATQFYGGGAGITGVTVTALSGTTAQLTTGLNTSGYVKVSGSTTLAGTGSMSDINMSGALSGSGDMMWYGNARFATGVYVTGAVSGASTLQAVGATVLGSTLTVSGAVSGAVGLSGGDLTVRTATLSGLLSSSAKANIIGAVTMGNKLDVTGAISGAAISGEAGTLTSLNMQAGGISNLGALGGGSTGQFTDVLTVVDVKSSGLLSSSAAAGLEIVGTSVFVGAMKMSGTVRMETGNSLSFNGSSNTAKITNNGSNLDINSPGPIILNANTFVSSGVGAQFVGNSIFGGNLDVSGNLAVGDSASDTMQVKAAAYFAGPEAHKLGTITAATELTASSARSYQIVSGGTSALTVTLPSASNSDYSYMIKRHSLMSGNVVITGSGGDAATQLIDGNASITLATVGASVFLISDGTQWNIF